MAWSLGDHLVFSAVMTVREIKREKERQFIKTQKYYQKCYEEIADESKLACDLIIRITQKASTVYFPSEIGEGIRHLPLFCFGEVLKCQGSITKEQEKILSIYFQTLGFSFTQGSYVKAMTGRGALDKFNRLMALSQTDLGEFWLNFFRAMYKSGTQEDFQRIIDSVSATIIRFSILGNPKSTIALSICEKLIHNANLHIQKCPEIPISEIDWMGIIPVPQRVSEMHTYHEALIRNSDITEMVSADELRQLFNVLFLHGIYEIVSMTKQQPTVQIQMVENSLRYVGIDLGNYITPRDYIYRSGPAGMFYELFSCSPVCGQYWGMLLIMASKANRQEDLTLFVRAFLSILIQVEDMLQRQYPFMVDKQYTKQYATKLLSALVKTIGR